MITRNTVEELFSYARDLIEGGDGFTLAVTLITGQIVTGITPSTQDIQAPEGDHIALEVGDVSVNFIPYASILTVEVHVA